MVNDEEKKFSNIDPRPGDKWCEQKSWSQFSSDLIYKKLPKFSLQKKWKKKIIEKKIEILFLGVRLNADETAKEQPQKANRLMRHFRSQTQTKKGLVFRIKLWGRSFYLTTAAAGNNEARCARRFRSRFSSGRARLGLVPAPLPVRRGQPEVGLLRGQVGNRADIFEPPNETSCGGQVTIL